MQIANKKQDTGLLLDAYWPLTDQIIEAILNKSKTLLFSKA